MKTFTFFEDTEGGMEIIGDVYSEEDLSCLRGWMCKLCEAHDKSLLIWMETALVGQRCDHRLGVLVRMADVADSPNCVS